MFTLTHRKLGVMEALDPRQTLFLTYYLDPKSDTFSNAYQSAVKAGYSEEYSLNITALMPDWLSESIGRRKRMLAKAEERLEHHLESEDEKISLDASKFVAKTLGKNEGYSERTELTGRDGKDLPTPILGGISQDVSTDNSPQQNTGT